MGKVRKGSGERTDYDDLKGKNVVKTKCLKCLILLLPAEMEKHNCVLHLCEKCQRFCRSDKEFLHHNLIHHTPVTVTVKKLSAKDVEAEKAKLKGSSHTDLNGKTNDSRGKTLGESQPRAKMTKRKISHDMVTNSNGERSKGYLSDDEGNRSHGNAMTTRAKTLIKNNANAKQNAFNYDGCNGELNDDEADTSVQDSITEKADSSIVGPDVAKKALSVDEIVDEPGASQLLANISSTKTTTRTKSNRKRKISTNDAYDIDGDVSNVASSVAKRKQKGSSKAHGNERKETWNDLPNVKETFVNTMKTRRDLSKGTDENENGSISYVVVSGDGNGPSPAKAKKRNRSDKTNKFSVKGVDSKGNKKRINRTWTQCGSCIEKFSTLPHLSHHMVTAHHDFSQIDAIKNFKCHVCGDFCASPYKLKRHNTAVHDGTDKKIVCGKCSEEFTDSAERDVHYMSCRLYGCGVCKLTFSEKRALITHKIKSRHLKVVMGNNISSKSVSQGIKKRRNPTRKQCGSCPKNFPGLPQLSIHMITEHHDFSLINAVKRFKCAVCGDYFNAKGKLKYHDDALHKGTDRRVVCAKCSEEFADYKERDSHYISCNLYKCGVCKKTFVDRKALLSHKISKGHSINKLNELTKTASVVESEGHESASVKSPEPRKAKKMVAVTKEKEFKDCKRPHKHKCAPCEKRFSHLRHLAIHRVNVHEDFGMIAAIKYHCQVCGDFFVSPNQLRKHKVAVHDGTDQRVVCAKCSEEFNDLKERDAHYMSCRLYKCGACNAIFKQRELLLRHKNAMGHMKLVVSNELLATKVGVELDDLESNEGSHGNHCGKKVVHKCLTCGRIFKLKMNLQMHFRRPCKKIIVRVDGESQPVSESLRTASNDDDFPVEKRKKVVRKRSINKFVYDCPICKEEDEDKYVMRNHIEHVHGQLYEVHETCSDFPHVGMRGCFVCDARYYNICQLKRHFRLDHKPILINAGEHPLEVNLDENLPSSSCEELDMESSIANNGSKSNDYVTDRVIPFTEY